MSASEKVQRLQCGCIDDGEVRRWVREDEVVCGSACVGCNGEDVGPVAYGVGGGGEEGGDVGHGGERG